MYHILTPKRHLTSNKGSKPDNVLKYIWEGTICPYIVMCDFVVRKGAPTVMASEWIHTSQVSFVALVIRGL